VPHYRTTQELTVTIGPSDMRTRWWAALALLLCSAGVALIAAGCGASRSGPPGLPDNTRGALDSVHTGTGSAAQSLTVPGIPAGAHDGAGSRSGSGSERSSATTAGNRPARAPGTGSGGRATSTPATDTADPPAAAGAPAATTRISTSAPTAAAGVPTPVTGPILQASVPTRLGIPALGVSSPLVRLGLNPDGTVQVPDLDDPDSKAGWYENSPTPGTAGPSVILGHVDSAKYGPGVFYRLGDLRPGDEVDVTRADGTVAVFRVRDVRSFSKDQFPTLQVYGNIDHAGLRLITCGGQFDYDKHSYESNIVAFARLVAFRRSG
jgi:LPXTG-site transpeptidase (sortase) family protein